MKIRTLACLCATLVASAVMSVVAHAASDLYIGSTSLNGTDAVVPLYVNSTDAEYISSYGCTIDFDKTKLTYESATDVSGGNLTSKAKVPTNNSGILKLGYFNTNGVEINDAVKVAEIKFTVKDTSLTAEDISSGLTVNIDTISTFNDEWTATKTIDSSNYKSFVKFVVPSDLKSTVTGQPNIVGMAVMINGNEYTDTEDGTLKYNEDTSGNYIFTVKLNHDTNETVDIDLIAKTSSVDDGAVSDAQSSFVVTSAKDVRVNKTIA